MPMNKLQRGFTLIELVMVIVILGVVGSMVAVFMRAPIDAYFDAGRRAALTDVADTALRRMARDIQRALPNSIRTNAAGTCIEFIPTRTGGRYRGQDSAAGNSLAFNVADATFNMLGTNAALPANEQIQANDLIAVYNLGIPGANAYAGNNTAVVAGVADVAGEAQIAINPAVRFPFQSPNFRFHVIPFNETIVSYVCAGGVLFRNTNYGYGLPQSCPAVAPPAPGARSIMANNATACAFTYNANVDLQRNALVQMTLQLSNANNTEAVNLYHEVHVNNTP